jgi:hypothetical protein
MPVKAHNQFWDEDVELPDHIVDRTENLLGARPMTNQKLIVDTLQWWINEVGNCPIYRYILNHLDALENDDVLREYELYVDAKEQARSIGLDVP